MCYNNGMNEKVSIIVPIYNAKKYLHKCINSLLSQTYENLEIILVDDGSNDGSEKIVDDYTKKDARIKTIRQQNAGQSAARNAGMRLASGDFIGFIDDDDEVEKTFVEELVKTLEDNCLSVCGMRYRYLKNNTERVVFTKKITVPKDPGQIKTFVLKNLVLDGRFYSAVNKLYRANIIKDNKIEFPEDKSFGEDTTFVLQYLDHVGNKIGFSLKPLYIYNIGTSSSTMAETSTVKKNWKKLHKTFVNWVGNPTMKERFWLNALSLRWKVSYIKRRH